MGSLIFDLIGLVVLYFVIRLAVSDGMRDAWRRRERDALRRSERGAWKRGKRDTKQEGDSGPQ